MKKLTYGLLALVLAVTNVTLVTSTASATQTRLEAEYMYRDYGTREIVYDTAASANYKRVMTTNGGAWNYFSSTEDHKSRL